MSTELKAECFNFDVVAVVIEMSKLDGQSKAVFRVELIGTQRYYALIEGTRARLRNTLGMKLLLHRTWKRPHLIIICGPFYFY
ncbi:MAG: hypothetical protein OSA51_13225 [Octadecabacter sp.]|nr:hypothetical protein [Octadecabacter sp.]